MKLATIEVSGPPEPTTRIAALAEDGETFVDLTASYAHHLAGEGTPSPTERARAVVPPDMVAFLERTGGSFEVARTALRAGVVADASTGPDGQRLRYDRDAVDLRSPLPRPPTLRDCIAFEEHVGAFNEEIPDAWYEMPVYYKGNPRSVVPPGGTVPWPDYTDYLDYELEVAIVVGRAGRDLSAESAMDHVAGFTVFDDFSARDVQRREMTVDLGPSKGKDFANGLGPFLVTADAFDPDDATMVARVDGEVWSEGNFGSIYHSVAEIVAHASRGERLYPGDVIGSGTVGGGCGAELDRWLSPGDRIELEVEGLGTLEHVIGEPGAALM